MRFWTFSAVELEEVGNALESFKSGLAAGAHVGEMPGRLFKKAGDE
jgi:hypothetical protein